MRVTIRIDLLVSEDFLVALDWYVHDGPSNVIYNSVDPLG